jgi:predicted short-subunit dehydrogenase-like oxidoreductase (DUF2520 family)
MRIVLAGPGRAGLAVAIAANGAGHDVLAVAARETEQAERAARRFDAEALAIVDPIPPVDLLIIAVRDDAIAEVAGRVAPIARNAAASAVHLSGSAPIDALAPIADQGLAVGSLHPLQTISDPVRGARALAGAWFAVTADEPLRSDLHGFARSLGGRPFDLAGEHRTAYHAGAAAAANFPIAALAIAQRLFEVTGVPFEAARPLVDAIVENAFAIGPVDSLTGPIARNDHETVDAQIAAVRAAVPSLAAAFESMVGATADVATLSRLEESS